MLVRWIAKCFRCVGFCELNSAPEGGCSVLGSLVVVRCIGVVEIVQKDVVRYEVEMWGDCEIGRLRD